MPKFAVNGLGRAASASPALPALNGQGVKPPSNPLPAFRDFMKHEKQRSTQKYQAHVKSDMDKGMADLVKFSQNFKVGSAAFSINVGVCVLSVADHAAQHTVIRARKVCR